MDGKIVLKNKDKYGVSRVLYWLEAAFAYFIDILAGGAFLAKLTFAFDFFQCFGIHAAKFSVIVIVKRNKMLHHKDVHSNLGCEIYNVYHIRLIFTALVTLSSVTARGLVTVLYGSNILHRNILTVNTWHKPTASVLP